MQVSSDAVLRGRIHCLFRTVHQSDVCMIVREAVAEYFSGIEGVSCQRTPDKMCAAVTSVARLSLGLGVHHC